MKNTKTGYAYSYQDQGCVELAHGSHSGPPPTTGSWIIQLKCNDLHQLISLNGLIISVPKLASMRWLLKLYGLVMSGLGIILSLAWVCFHIFVLSVTNLQELRQQRCVIIYCVTKKSQLKDFGCCSF